MLDYNFFKIYKKLKKEKNDKFGFCHKLKLQKNWFHVLRIAILINFIH